MTTWANDFEASPADADEAKYGANKIRELKTAISERLEREMNFKAGTSPLLKAGIASVIYYGDSAGIAGLANVANGALAYNTTLKGLMAYNASVWTAINLSHSGLANLTDADSHTQYLNVNKANQTLQKDLLVTTSIKIDGYDISALGGSFENHDANTASVAHTGGIGNAFGAWSTGLDQRHVYTASTDGFVTAYSTSTALSMQTPSATDRVALTTAIKSFLGGTMPVRKGATWQVLAASAGDTVFIYWLPIGS
jgi:hypothetical protein